MMKSNLKFQDLTPWRKLFPITREYVYLNHASTGPMSVLVEKKIKECVSIYKGQAEFHVENYFARLRKAREAVASLIHAEPDEIAFVPNTSEGIYIALINLPMKQGDKILVMEEVFPTVRYVVDYNIPHIEKKYIAFSGKDIIKLMRKHIDRKVKAVILDYVQFLSGEMTDLERLGKFLRERGIHLVVDGMQAVGTFDFSVQKTHVDFLACGSGKWLFTPAGIGFLYVNKRNFKILKKLHTGWLGVDWKNWENFEVDHPLFKDARMFEMATRNMIGILSVETNCRMLMEVGLKAIFKQIQMLKSHLRNGFRELGFKIITPETGPQSGIITARPPKPREVYNRLKKNKIIISLRNNYLRFSPHFYNTIEEIERVFHILSQNQKIVDNI